MKPLSVGLAWGHVVCYRNGLLGEVHALIYHGWAEVGHVRCVGKGGGRLKVGEYAGAGLVGFFRIALYVMIGGVGAE